MRNRIYKLGTALTSALLIAAGVTALRAQSGPCIGLPQVTATAAAADGTVVAIALAADAGCAWTAATDSPADAALDTAGATGPATVNVTLTNNANAAPRAITVTFTDSSATAVSFVINQLGTACTYSMVSPPAFTSKDGGNGSFLISTQPNCAWSVTAAAPFVSFAPSSGFADASGSATINYTVDANTGETDTRRSLVAVAPPGYTVFDGQEVLDVAGVFVKYPAQADAVWYLGANAVLTQVSQGGDSQSTPLPWNVGDVFAGIGSWWSDFGTYRVLNPDGTLKASPDLHDASGTTTTFCAIDPSVPSGDLFTTAWDGLKISRFDSTSHQLVAALDLSPAGLATVQRKTGTVPVPSTENLLNGGPGPDIAYSEQLVFDGSGNFYVGGSMYASPDQGLGYAYLLKFAKNDDHSIAGCPAAGPCLLDWWRVDSGGETPTGTVPAGTNAQWTQQYKAAYVAATGTDAARAAAALDAVAPLAPALSPIGPGGSAGVDEVDLSSDGHTIFYTSEDNHIRKFDTLSGTQLTPLTLADPNGGAPYHLKAYGFRLLPDGQGHADGSAGMIVATSTSVFRVDGTGTAIKVGNNIADYPVDSDGTSHPFAMNLTPDAQSFWVATTQEDSSNPGTTGGKVYRFHIPTRKRYGPFNIGTGGADIDIQGLCVKREYTAGVNQCFQTDKDGKGVLDQNGNPIAIPCVQPVLCEPGVYGVDINGAPNAACYPPGEAPLTVADRSSFEGDKSGDGGTSDLDLLALLPGRRITTLGPLPPGLQPVTDPASGDIVGVGGTVSYLTCPKPLERYDLASDPDTVCSTIHVGIAAADGAVASFDWNIHYRNAPAFFTPEWPNQVQPTLPVPAGWALPSVKAIALRPLNAPTNVWDPDSEDGLITHISATAFDASTNSWVTVVPHDYGFDLLSPPAPRVIPSAGNRLAVVGSPRGYPLAAPNYPSTFAITIDMWDCNQQVIESQGFGDPSVPAATLTAACFHHTSATFNLEVDNELPRFVSGFGPGPDYLPVFVNSGVDQYSNIGESLASASAEYQLTANDSDLHLPVAFSFACTNANGSANPTACGPNGLPAGLTYKYATSVPGVYAAAPDPTNLSRTNQYVIIGGTPTAAANDLLITATLTDLAGGRNVDPFTFHWTVHGGPELTLTDQATVISTPTIYTFDPGTSPNGYYPLHYSVSGMPPFLTFTESTRTFSPSTTAPTAGRFGPITVTVTDTPPAGHAQLTGQASFYWTINAPPIVSAINQFSRRGVALASGYLFCSEAPCATSPNGNPLTYAVTGGALPAGLSLDPSTGAISGTPSNAINAQSVTITVTDTVNHLATPVTFAWTIYDTPTLSVADQTSMINAAASYTPSASSTPSGLPLSFAVDALPPGITLDASTGKMSGTPTTAVDAQPVTVTVTETVAPGITLSSHQSFTWTVKAPPTLTVADQFTQVNGPVQVTFCALPSQSCGASNPAAHGVTYAISATPPGVTMDPATGHFSGVPNQVGVYNLSVTVTDSVNGLTTTAPFKWTVYGKPTVSAVNQSSLLNVPLPSPYTPTAAASPAGVPLTFAYSGLPHGLTYDPNTGTISGTPDTPINPPASVQVVVTEHVTSTITTQESATFTWLVYAIGSVSAAPQTTLLGASVSYTPALTGVPTTQQPVTWDIQNLPGGLTFNSSTGEISGHPTTPVVNQTVTVNVTDSLNHLITTTFLWTVNAPPIITVANQLSFIGTGIAPYKIAVTDPDNSTPLTVNVAGLPNGLSYNAATGYVTGTPAAGTANLGGYTITVTAKDGLGAVVTGQFLWVIDTPPIVAAADQSTLVNTAVSYTPLASDPDGQAVTYTISNLPAGLTYNGSTGTISGAPTGPAGTQLVTVTVTDPMGASASTTFRWTVYTNRPPVCSAATVTPGLLWPPNHKLVPFGIANVTDPDGDRVSVLITSITQDQPIDGLGDGHTPQFDATGVGTSSGAVRAERTGLLRVPDDGRLYQVNFTATDPLGASCTGTVFLGVPHDQGQHNLPSDNLCRWDSTTGAQLTPCAWLHAPTLNEPDRSNREGDAVSVQIVANDPDNTPLTYTASGLPPGLTMSSSGLITGTVAAGAAGRSSKKYTVTVSANDGYGAGTDTFVWTILRRVAGQQQASVPDDDRAASDTTQVEATAQSGPSAQDDPVVVPISGGGPAAAAFVSVPATLSAPTVVEASPAGGASTSVSAPASVEPPPSSSGSRSGATPDTTPARDNRGDGAAATADSSKTAGNATSSGTHKAGDSADSREASKAVSGGDAALKDRADDEDHRECAREGGPVIDRLLDRTDLAGDESQLDVKAADPRGHVLTFAAKDLPAGLTIDAAGKISGTIDASAKGKTYHVLVSASDGYTRSTQTFAWKVQ